MIHEDHLWLKSDGLQSLIELQTFQITQGFNSKRNKNVEI